ncbi:hypothetical protein KACHI17_04840 [Sediminibacterium sp. KACHI17]|uniref:GLPGLI family protein n=1 Tax=Sediminibacterium sp. KACHI17 TaxID=1751071 RepID=A0AAT9GGG5_9BACT
MKKIHVLFLLIVLIFSYKIQAQDAQTTKLMVKYEFIYVIDSTMPEKPNTYEGLLIIGNGTSFFGERAAMRSELYVKNQRESNPTMSTSMTLFYGAPVYFFRNLPAGKFSSVAKLRGNTYLLNENITTPDWKISPETKEIKGYTCQKATTEFKGRFYEVWFCPKVPYPYGPWKLGGLPGLILEASDSKKEIVFNFKSMQDTAAFAIELPENTIPTTTKELNKAIEAYQISLGSPSAGKTMISQSEGQSAASTRRRMYNNPIEIEKY